MRVAISLLMIVLSGCGTTVSVGAGYDLQNGRWDDQYNGQYRNISSDPKVGTVRIASPTYQGFGAEYFHASGISGRDYTPVDIASINYTMVIGHE